MATYKHFRGPYGNLKPIVAYKGGITRISELHRELIIEVAPPLGGGNFVIPLKGTVNVEIDWGDGSPLETFTTPDPSHIYSSSGLRTIKVTGSATVFGTVINNSNPPVEWRTYVRAIRQWGELGSTSFMGLFRFIPGNVELPNYIPPTVTNIVNMFAFSDNFNHPIGNWDTGNISDMSRVFEGADSFNQPLGNWNVSNVTNMTSMFSGANTSFNQDISGWDTRNVTSMLFMFFKNPSFNQNINAWDTSSVTVMQGMFQEATAFNQYIGGWNTGSLRFANNMFRDATAFNQNIGGWDTVNLTQADSMFQNATSFNQDLSGWCVPIITTEPTDFDLGATSWVLPRPVWGTCP